MKKSPSYSVPALEKGLAILEAIARSPHALSLADLSKQLKKSRSELFRMLNCLESVGYLHRDSTSSKYSLSLKLFDLTRLNNPIEKLRQAARLPMRLLANAIRESCHLCILHQGQISIIDQVESPEKFRISCEIGSFFDPLQTGSGKLLLSRLSSGEQSEAFKNSILWKNASAPERKSILDQIQKLATTGVYHQESDNLAGVEDLVVLIEGKSAGFRATLAVSRFVKRKGGASQREVDLALLAAAKEIAQNLGFDLK